MGNLKSGSAKQRSAKKQAKEAKKAAKAADNKERYAREKAAKEEAELEAARQLELEARLGAAQERALQQLAAPRQPHQHAMEGQRLPADHHDGGPTSSDIGQPGEDLLQGFRASFMAGWSAHATGTGTDYGNGCHGTGTGTGTGAVRGVPRRVVAVSGVPCAVREMVCR